MTIPVKPAVCAHCPREFGVAGERQPDGRVAVFPQTDQEISCPTCYGWLCPICREEDYDKFCPEYSELDFW